MIRNRKRVLALAVVSAISFSSMGMAVAAEPIEKDFQSAIILMEEGKEGAELETETETSEETKDEDETEASKETETENQTETSGETEAENETEASKETEAENETETPKETGAGNETEASKETGAENETETPKETGAENETEASKETGAENETETPKETGVENETEASKETEAETSEETKAENEAETSGNGSSSALQKPGLKPSINPIPAVHEHSWSADWNYDGTCHWHECGTKDCPVAEDNEKEGYGEHNYDDYGVCTDCGFDAMEGIAVTALEGIPTYQEAYDAMAALKEDFPEGMTWTNFEPYGSKGELGDVYTWNGGAVYGAKSAVGCMAFAFILSDEAFGNLPARVLAKGSFTFEDVKTGDILRINNNSHSVIVLRKSTGGVTVAEANYNGTVHWGRSMSAAAVEKADFIITRYPKGYVPDDDPDADEVIQDGTVGSIRWSLTGSNVLTLSGSGAIPNYSSSTPSPWSGYTFYTVVIEEGITGIGDYAFYQSEALSVYIPDSVKTIGQNAFYKSDLVEVTIPGTVKAIGNSAFYECGNLISATVLEGVETIGDSAFYGCTSLAYIDFPASITSVGAGAFMSCKEMVSMRFKTGSSNVTLGDNLFSQCWKLTDVTLPQTADRISAGMFASCTSLSELYIPATVREIGEHPFTSSLYSGIIYFGGSETEWNRLANVTLKYSLQSTNTTVVFDAEFDDPFAKDPDDPGDFKPGENEPCTNHVDSDNDGKCDICGEPVTPDKPGSDGGNGEDNSGSGSGDSGGNTGSDNGNGGNNTGSGNGNGGNNSGSGNGNGGNNSGSGNGNDGNNSGSDNGNGGNNSGSDGDKKDPDNPGGNKPPTTGGSSGGSSGSSDESSSYERNSGSDSDIISNTFRRKADGSYVITRTQRDGTVISITADGNGRENIEVRLPDSEIVSASQKGETVDLPISAVEAAKDISTASVITVYTQSNQPVKVAIPVVLPTPDTVAVIVNGDGSTTVISSSVPAGNRIVASLPNGAAVKIVNNGRSFSDVPARAWFEDAVSFVSARELFQTTSETEFSPGSPMTRAMLATALARLDGVQTHGGATWYEKAAAWSAARRIWDGSEPDSNITCGQLMTMIWKYHGSPVAEDKLSGSEYSGQMNEEQKAMDWAVRNGFAGIFGKEIPDPQSPVNRSQAAWVIMEFVKKCAL